MDFVTQNLAWIALAVVSGGRVAWLMAKGGNRSEVSPADATLLMNREHAVMVDVRDTTERAGGYIANSRHIALDTLEQQVDKLEKFKTRPIVLYCASGARSAKGCNVLRKKGFTQVYNLGGGIAAWREAGMPVTTK